MSTNGRSAFGGKIKQEIIFILVVFLAAFVVFNRVSASTSDSITLTDPNATSYSSPTLQTSNQTLTGSDPSVTLTNPQNTNTSQTTSPSSSSTLNSNYTTLNAPTYTTSPTLDVSGKVSGDSNTPNSLTAPSSNSCLGLGVKSGDPCTTSDYKSGQCLPYGNSLMCVANMIDTSGLGKTPASAPATTVDSCANGNCSFANPLGFNTISQGLALLIKNLQGIVATIAIIFIIIGGIMYMLSAGDETMIKRAKATWTGAVIGLAIIFASPAFLKEIGVILGINQTNSAVAGALSLQQIALNVLGFLFSIVGIIAIISMIIGGVIYLTAYGDEKRIDTAKKILTSSILGVVIVFAALIIVNQIRTLLGG